MPDLFNFSQQMQEYFNSLSPMVQETIAQSGAKLNSLEDLKAVSNNISGNDNTQNINKM